MTTVAFYYRMDHTAHLVAGTGLVAVIWALLVALGRPGPVALAGSVVVVVAAAAVSEVTVFGPRVDASDVLFTVAGAILGAAALTQPKATRRSSPSLLIVGGALIAVGIFVRYRLQFPFSEWWYSV